MSLELKLVTVEKPDEVNLILGHSHFIKTVEDLYEAVVGSVPGVEFGLEHDVPAHDVETAGQT